MGNFFISPFFLLFFLSKTISVFLRMSLGIWKDDFQKKVKNNYLEMEKETPFLYEKACKLAQQWSLKLNPTEHCFIS